MATLKELMGDKTRGDGRKFTMWLLSEKERWFEPVFKDRGGQWSGFNEDGYCETFSDGEVYYWEEWTPSKHTKKVKMYRYIAKNVYEDYSLGSWSSNKCSHPDCIGWQEMEIEVDE